MHFPSLNHEKTIRNAKQVLRNYSSFHKMELSLKITLKSPIISAMPKSATVGNAQEEKIIDKLEERHYAMYYCELIRDVVSIIQDPTYQKIITDTYLCEGISDLAIMLDLNMGKSQYYANKRQALIVFAECMPAFKDARGNMIDIAVYKKN
ncbi:ArpU family phage packaging/lysis transcriptional regulator [Fructilactobacillus sp. Tb1]|uniref:ArpU family phage packaging/lysis transcriptional regulator n=1 Tax=Fructilactobacillus sp. Tb1 TaxID=3422304 RepID=UPI003D298C3D